MKMRFGVGMGRSESVNKVGEHARLAEDCGFELVTLVDEPFLARDIFTALAMVAVNTERVLIGHGVVDPLTYFPTALGNSAATLNELSGGVRSWVWGRAARPASSWTRCHSSSSRNQCSFSRSSCAVRKLSTGGT